MLIFQFTKTWQVQKTLNKCTSNLEPNPKHKNYYFGGGANTETLYFQLLQQGFPHFGCSTDKWSIDRLRQKLPLKNFWIDFLCLKICKYSQTCCGQQLPSGPKKHGCCSEVVDIFLGRVPKEFVLVLDGRDSSRYSILLIFISSYSNDGKWA